MAAIRALEEIDDYMEVLDQRLTKLNKNIDRFIDTPRNTAERKKLQESCDRDIDKIGKDIKSL